MKSLAQHIELVRELGLDQRIRRRDDYTTRRAAADLVVGTVLGFGVVGALVMGNLLIERLTR